MVEFDPVQLGQRARRIVVFTNGGDSTADGLAATFDGADAAAFTADVSVESIPASGASIVTIDQAGDGTTGDKHAQLHFGGMTIELLGHGVAATSGLLSTSANVELIGVGGLTTQLELSNQGQTTLALTGVTADGTGLFANAYYHYVSQLPPLGQGEVNVDVALTGACGSGILHLATDHANLEVSVHAMYLPTVQVTVAGDGHGTVTAANPSARGPTISCNNDDPAGNSGICSSFATGKSIMLTASPENGDHFLGWSGGPCGTDPVCIAPIGPVEQLSFVATFAPAAYVPIEVNIQGNGRDRDLGYVQLPDGTRCTAACTTYVPGGGLAGVTLTAKAFSSFVGWSGDCSGVDASCSLSVLANAGHTVTATFGGDSVSSQLLPPTYGGPVAMLASGDLVTLGSSVGVTRLSRIGGQSLPEDHQVVWTEPLLYTSQSVVASASDIIYVTGQTTLWALDANGKLLWSKPSAGPAIATFGDDVVVASTVDAPNGVAVYSAVDGSLKWTSPINPQAAAATASMLAIASNTEIHRFQPGGAEILPVWTTPGSSSVSSMSFDPDGNLVVLGAVYPNGGAIAAPPVLSKLSPAGTQIFSHELGNDASGATLGDGVVRALSNGKIAALRRHYAAYASTLDEVELYDTNGTLVWGFQKGTGWTTGDSHFPFGFSAQFVAAGAGFVIAGSYYPGFTVVEGFTQ